MQCDNSQELLCVFLSLRPCQVWFRLLRRVCVVLLNWTHHQNTATWQKSWFLGIAFVGRQVKAVEGSGGICGIGAGMVHEP